MPYVDFKRGDLLIHGKFHALIWVGGEKPLVHNVDKGTFVGVIRAKSLTASCRVFRFHKTEIAEQAADYAQNWAEIPGDDFKLPIPAPAKIVLKSPYSHQRMNNALIKEGSDTPWTVDSLFRALKAIARGRDGTGFSPNRGVSCSQFVTFCYQAAALKLSLSNIVPGNLIDQIRRTTPGVSNQTKETWVDANYSGYDPANFWKAKAFEAQQKVFKSLKDDRSFIHGALSPHVEATSKLLPQAMQTDAKLTTVEKLLKDLQAPNSDFQYTGMSEDNETGADIPYRIRTS